MNDDQDWQEDNQDDSIFYGYWRDISGNLKPIGTFVRNGRVVPRPPFDMTEPDPADNQDDLEEEMSQSYLEFEDAAFSNLAPEERRIARLAMVHKKANGEIGKTMGVSPSAISQRLHSLAKKNQAVRLWWRRKNKINQHA